MLVCGEVASIQKILTKIYEANYVFVKYPDGRSETLDMMRSEGMGKKL